MTLQPSTIQAQEQHHADSSGHLLQSPAWGELKSRFGWDARWLQAGSASAQVLFRRLPLGRSITYIPKGPLLAWDDPVQVQALLTTIHAEARQQGAIFLKVEPDVSMTDPQAEMVIARLREAGFTPADTIQPRTTQIIDLSPAEVDILAAMKQKTRYNIRLAKRKGITIRAGQADDVALFHELSQLTAERDDFGVHSRAYYQAAYDLFAPDQCALLLADYKGKSLAGLMVFRHGADAYYLYGASSNEERNRMPTYAVQWAAMQWAKERGCIRYDLWGIPDADAETLEAEFMKRNDGLWGVYRFKRGFGGDIVRSIGAFDYVYNGPLYQIYRLYRKV